MVEIWILFNIDSLFTDCRRFIHSFFDYIHTKEIQKHEFLLVLPSISRSTIFSNMYHIYHFELKYPIFLNSTYQTIKL